jgi:hypothetical protein
MPFFDVGVPLREEELTPSMPRPLSVSINDKDRERDGLTTAVLINPFGYRDDQAKLQIVVPAGFLTDFASIPGWARAIVSPFGRHAKAAVLHDWLYAIGEPGRKDVADHVFDHAMRELQVETWAREIMFGAVQVGGGHSYDRAATDWPTTFADPATGQVTPPQFTRESAFLGQPNGPKTLP